MKKILLLGDSIRISYQPLVKEKLNGIAEVLGPGDNCRFVKYTLWYINSWIDEFGKPDIIHWNNGLWDVYHFCQDSGIFTTLEDYTSEIRRVLQRLKKTGAEIIWATTTPVNNNNINCKNSDIDQYNEAIIKYMQKENIYINDLNSVVKSDIGLYIGEDYMHLSDKGQIICAEAVSRALMRYN